jgi:hypothetical protein
LRRSTMNFITPTARLPLTPRSALIVNFTRGLGRRMRGFKRLANIRLQRIEARDARPDR